MYIMKFHRLLINKPLFNWNIAQGQYYMSGTFVTSCSLFTTTNKVFHSSNKEETNISNKADVYY